MCAGFAHAGEDNRALKQCYTLLPSNGMEGYMRLAALVDCREICSAGGAVFQRGRDRGKHARVKPTLHTGTVRKICGFLQTPHNPLTI